MPKKAKSTTKTGPSFEEAFAELQGIVGKLESTTTSVEDALAFYERGQSLVSICTRILEQTELRIRELSAEKNEAGMTAHREN